MKENNDKAGKLKLIHLIWLLLAMALTVGVAWGVVVNQQKVNSKAIEKKMDRDLFDMHQEQQMQQFESLQTIMKDGFARIDKRLEKIENNKGD